MRVNETNKLDDNIELCEGHHIHPHISPDEIPGDEILYSLADLYKVFGDPTPNPHSVRPVYPGDVCL